MTLCRNSSASENAPEWAICATTLRQVACREAVRLSGRPWKPDPAAVLPADGCSEFHRMHCGWRDATRAAAANPTHSLESACPVLARRLVLLI